MIKNKTKKGLAVLFSILTIFHSVYASGDKISVKNSNTAHNNKKDSQNNSQKIYSYLEYLGCKVKHFKDRLKDNLKPYWDNVPLKYSVICLMGVVVAVFLPSSSKKDKSKSKTDDIKDDIEEEKKITVATNKNFIDVNHEMLIYVHAISLFVNDPKRALMFDLKNETLEIKTQYIDVINVLDDNFKFPPIQDTINYIISECETKNESEYTSKDSDTETFVFGKSKCDTSYTKDTDYINKVKTAIGRMSKNKKITPDELQQFNTLCLEIKNLKKDLNETLKKDNASAKKIVGTREKIRKIDSRLLHTIKNEILSIISSILEKAGYDDVGNIKKVNPVSVPTSVPVSVPASNKHLVSSDQKLNHTEEIYISGTKFTLKKDNNKLEFNAKVAAKPLLITFFIDSKTIEISGNFGDIVRNNIIGSVYDKTVDLYKSQNFKNYSLFINGDLEICTPMIQVFKNYISKTINPKEITLREGARIICSGPDGIIYIFNKFNEAEMEFSCGYCVDNIAKYDPEYKLIVDTKTKNIKILGLCQKDECEICIAMNSKLKKSLINKCIETVGHMTHDKKGVYTIHFSGNDKKDLEIEFRCFFGIFNNLSGKNLDNLFFEGNVKLIELVNDKEIVKTTLLLEDKKNIMAEVVIGDMKLFISKNSKTVNISSIKLDEEQIKCLIEYIKKIM
ncbi:MAG: hypothetical protein FWC41_07720, partial [Firmicutes bacterium]|nr:hypothetical protein [Bacillota bacterium]